AIAQSKGNVLAAARLLGLSRNALRYRMQRYGIARVDPAPATPLPSAAVTVHAAATSAISAESSEPIWEKKPAAVLTIELTFRADDTESFQRPWTLARRWEQACAERVHGFGGLLLERSPSLYTVVFGVPSALDRMPERALHAALAIRRLVEESSE